MVVTRGWGVRKLGRSGLRVQTCQEMNESWRSNAQRGDYSQQYYVIYFEATKRLDLHFSYHEKEVAVTW